MIRNITGETFGLKRPACRLVSLIAIIALAAVIGISLAGCPNDSSDDDDGASVAKADLVGTWKKGTHAFTLTDTSFSNSDGETGPWSVSGSTLTIDGKTYTVALSADKKKLTVSKRGGSQLEEGDYTKQ